MIVLLLGVATVAAFVRVGGDDGGSRLAQTGPGTTVVSTSTTSTTSTSVPSTTSTTKPPATTATTAAPGTTAAPATNDGSSGLGTGGAGQVAMGPTIPNTGIESALAPGVALLGAGVGLRMLLTGRRRPHDA